MSLSSEAIATGGRGGFQTDGIVAAFRFFDGRVSLVTDGVLYQRPPLSKAFMPSSVGDGTLGFRPEKNTFLIIALI
jgi:hypothetical protein